MFLREFAETHPELDDRPERKPSVDNVDEPIETLLDVVHKTMPDIHWQGDGCPGLDKFSAAFSAAGYVQPGISCPAVDCRTCWLRPAEKFEPVKPESAPSHYSELKSWIDCVEQFNCRMEADQDKETRLKLIKDEIGELVAAMTKLDPASDSEEEDDARKEILDAVCNSIYTLIGLSNMFGFNLDAAFYEVHRSNMSKLGPDGKPIKREDGKILKGPNFTPPDLTPYI